MIRVFTDIIEIWGSAWAKGVYTYKNVSRTVMLSTCPDAFLGVVGAFQFCEVGIGINCSEENRFVLRVILYVCTESQ